MFSIFYPLSPPSLAQVWLHLRCLCESVSRRRGTAHLSQNRSPHPVPCPAAPPPVRSQASAVCDWMQPEMDDCAAVILCGDFNGNPSEPFHRELRRRGYVSAHLARHGHEPRVGGPLLALCSTLCPSAHAHGLPHPLLHASSGARCGRCSIAERVACPLMVCTPGHAFACLACRAPGLRASRRR